MPGELIRTIQRGELTDIQLSFAAEALGSFSDAFVVDTLLGLLGHAKSIVREGAVLGLAGHLTTPEVQEAIAQVIRDDPSQGVREAAQVVLE
jgi:hypothetical protein